MDGKGELKSVDGGCEPLSIIDDHSRYAVGLYAMKRFRSKDVWECLLEAFERAGMPEAMLMDRGAQWYSAHSARGLTALTVQLIKQGIEVIHGRVRHPQTQGKVERFHGTIEAAVAHKGGAERVADWACWLDEFRQEYNEVRPHEALGMETPASRWHRSEREYPQEPREWEYPSGTDVRRLTDSGTLREGGRLCFLSEALAGERVALERLPLETMVVRYRHMYVREFDLATGRTKAWVRPA